MISYLILSTLLQEPKPVTIKLQRDPVAMTFEKNRSMYFPSTVQLGSAKPATIRKEPVYEGNPSYGAISLGNGPGNSFVIVLAQKEDAGKLFVDLNQNGDLTDDPAPEWNRIEPAKAGQMASYRGTVVFPASYKDSKRTWKAPYGINFYWSPGRSQIGYFRASQSTGVAEIDGRRVEIKLVENGNTGVYSDRFDTVEDPYSLRPVTLVMNEQQRDARGTFDWEGVNYLATIAADGSSVTFTPTFKTVKAPPPKPTPDRKLLAPGAPAPDFTVESQNGESVQLSDYKGKVVVLKFWATWCGPCIASMPHFEKIYQKAKPQGVELLAVCVSDEKPAYQQWLVKNKSNYTYPFFFDPAGKTPNMSISGRLYNVTGIPTVYIIDKDGKVAESIVGYSEGDLRVEQALEKLGVVVK
jgi:peroxiredoxin